MSSAQTKTSPLDFVFPEKLKAHVVEVGASPSIHGFDAFRDLGENFDASERLLITLTGEEPLQNAAALMRRLLAAFSPRGVDEAPAHAGTVTRLFCASGENTMTNVLLALGAQANAVADWVLNEGTLAIDLSEAARWFLEADFIVDKSDTKDAREVFKEAFLLCGLQQPWQVATVWMQAALPCVVAESMSTTFMDFENYPMNLPKVVLAK